MRSSQAVSAISPERLVPLDLSRLCSPRAVLLPVIGVEPEFCAEEGWLDSVTESVCKGMDQVETVHMRVRPMAFVRCSRGGKTRALEELAHNLRKQRPDVPVVFVSFNNYSVIQEWELADPVAALCRRIAFAALNILVPTKHHYDRFAMTDDVSEKDILSWLGKSSCVLLIDELNLLNMDRKQAGRLADFLKTHFLVDSGRYFVFSSHWLPSRGSLAGFLDYVSERGIDIFQLPLISSMLDARKKFRWPDLSVQQALFRAHVSALIAVTRGSVPPPFDKRTAAIADVAHNWNDKSVKELLGSFLF
jgi:hypothetical protein